MPNDTQNNQCMKFEYDHFLAISLWPTYTYHINQKINDRVGMRFFSTICVCGGSTNSSIRDTLEIKIVSDVTRGIVHILVSRSPKQVGAPETRIYFQRPGIQTLTRFLETGSPLDPIIQEA